MFALRYVDTELPRPRWRATVNRRLHPRLQVGAEYNPAADEVGPLLTGFLITETERRPAVFVGTSSDRIGSPAWTRANFITVAKYLPVIRTSPYVSLNHSGWDDGWNVPFGANIELGAGWSVQPMYDGHRTHLLAGKAGTRYSVTLLWIWLERAGAAVSVGF